MGSLSRAIGPALGAALYWRFGAALPYHAGAFFLVLPLVLALRLAYLLLLLTPLIDSGNRIAADMRFTTLLSQLHLLLALAKALALFITLAIKAELTANALVKLFVLQLLLG